MVGSTSWPQPVEADEVCPTILLTHANDTHSMAGHILICWQLLGVPDVVAAVEAIEAQHVLDAHVATSTPWVCLNCRAIFFRACIAIASTWNQGLDMFGGLSSLAVCSMYGLWQANSEL